MSTRFEELAVSLTARKGNHPVLWLLFGGAAAWVCVLGIAKKETFIPIPRLWRALHGMPTKRFEEVSFTSEPLLFTFTTFVIFAFAVFLLTVGFVSIRFRSRAKKRLHRFSDIVSS